MLLTMRWQDRFLVFMEHQQLTQTELAKRLDMTQGAVGHWLSGRRELRLKDFIRLCKVSGANAQTILFGEPQEDAVLGKIKELLSSEPEKNGNYGLFESRLKSAPKKRKVKV